jgi:hypothetical protein
MRRLQLQKQQLLLQLAPCNILNTGRQSTASIIDDDRGSTTIHTATPIPPQLLSSVRTHQRSLHEANSNKANSTPHQPSLEQHEHTGIQTGSLLIAVCQRPAPLRLQPVTASHVEAVCHIRTNPKYPWNSTNSNPEQPSKSKPSISRLCYTSMQHLTHLRATAASSGQCVATCEMGSTPLCTTTSRATLACTS